MAIITEEAEDHHQHQEPKPKPKPAQKREVSRPQNPATTSQSSHTNPFVFWFYFTLAVSLITLFFVSLSSFSPQDPKSWFLSLPTNLRQHYSKGRTIKVQIYPNSSPVEVFAIENGPSSAENVLIVHGLGASSYSFSRVLQSLGSKDIHAIAIDLPGNGFSDKSVAVEEERENGVLERFWDVYSEIKEKGLFYAFDQIIETGQMPYQETEVPPLVSRTSVKALELGTEEVGKVLGQVIETMGLAPVHLVLHDSALAMSANWVLNNGGLVRSVTLVDTSVKPALPWWSFEVPVLRDAVLGVPFLHNKLISSYCVKRISSSDANAHGILMKGRGGGRAIAEIGKRLNHSFNVGEWGSSEGLISMPMQVLWSSGWSKEWREEGHRIAKALPRAKFVEHSGGRWPQEDAAEELAELIAKHVSSLPKSAQKVEDEPLPEHIQKMFNEARGEDRHHHHHHGHAQMGGYMDAYGMGHGWEG
ncbi:protein AUXIN RESPONSE 4 [Rhodamnia argentea]|uniref:Protein AUXIN RESPONSE 4 n=1 Tax=Rhodamnia argentea TaxID=178133 RepID=A0A8B8P549_9MYRT|nr:protein AUXIN RESPONSE 4 [Rhodamnia argentea]